LNSQVVIDSDDFSFRINFSVSEIVARLAFSALTLFVGRQEGHPACKKLSGWGAGVVVCLKRGADLHIAQLMPLPLTVSLVHGAVSLMISFSKHNVC